MKAHKVLLLLSGILLFFNAANLRAQSMPFTYQGQLKSEGTGVSGAFDFIFSLWDAVTGPAQVGNSITNSGVASVLVD